MVPARVKAENIIKRLLAADIVTKDQHDKMYSTDEEEDDNSEDTNDLRPTGGPISRDEQLNEGLIPKKKDILKDEEENSFLVEFSKKHKPAFIVFTDLLTFIFITYISLFY